MESHHDFDKTRDRDRGGRDDFASNVAVNDDRPWFHLMKRRRSVTETVNRNNDGVSAFEYSDDYRQGGLQSSEEYGNYPHPALENAVTPIKQTGESRASNSREVSSHLSKSHSGFRSGLDILLDSER